MSQRSQDANGAAFDHMLDQDTVIPKWRKGCIKLIAMIDKPTAINMYQQYRLRRCLLNSSRDRDGSLAICLVFIMMVLVMVAMTISS